jgi:uncharacterized protein YdhG (YjbR/CyaY superfamily)
LIGHGEGTAMAKKTENVESYMEKLDHPLKAEVQALRDIIKGVNENITEQIKWNAPSYRYKDYIATFNLRATHHVHLIFHNPVIASIESEILEGNYPDRRMVYFTDMNDVNAKKAAVEYVVQELMKRMDE